MHSVRYLSYHHWKESKGDSNKSSTYHQKLLANVENLETNVGAIDKLITGYLDATKAFCGAGSQLAEAFSTVLKETPLLEISQQLKQVVEEIDHVAHKSSVHITSQILGTLCEFTATLPGLKRAIEAHKRSAQNYESCQENLEVLEKDDSGVNSDSMRLKTTRQRFRAATEELVTEEEKLYRSFSEVEENRVKVRKFFNKKCCSLSRLRADILAYRVLLHNYQPWFVKTKYSFSWRPILFFGISLSANSEHFHV